MKNIVRYHDPDGWLLVITSALVFIGTVMVFSSSVIMADIRWGAPYAFFEKQILWLVLGGGVLYLMSKYDFKNIQKYSKIILIAGIVLLIVVLFLGAEKGGAKRWLRFGFFSFQPSEFVKIAIIIALADYFDRKKSKIKKIGAIIPAFCFMFIPCVLIMLEPDLGIPIVIFTVSLLLIYAAGARFTHVFGALLLVVPVVVFEILIKPYRLERMKNFIASWGTLESTSYQINQAIMAFGSGGFWGKGLAQSQMKLFHLPEPHTDFIFPIIGEELGFIGVIVIIGLFAAFLWRGWVISKNSPTFFGGLVGLGITWLISFQAFFNMAVSAGILPAKGLPLPFISFGGTSLFINMACVGILLNISKQATRTNIAAKADEEG